MKLPHVIVSAAVIVFFSAIVSSAAWADMAEIKKYKEAFPDEKAKCATCHTEALPKKDGNHELNAYGAKVTGISQKTTAETYKSAGKA